VPTPSDVEAPGDPRIEEVAEPVIHQVDRQHGGGQERGFSVLVALVGVLTPKGE
jgi:hypothetical protein